MTKGQQGVYDVLSRYGPLQHVVPTHLSSSGIRTRRHELVEIGAAEQVPDEFITMPSGRRARIFRAVEGF